MCRRTLVAVAVVALVSVQVAAQEVVLPLDKFEQLRKEAAWQPTPTPTPRPPAPWALESSQLDVTIGRRSARVDQELVLSLYDRGWQSVPLPVMGRLVEARLGTLEGRIAADAVWTLRVRGSGRYRIHLVSVVGVNRNESAARPTWRLSLPLPKAAVVHGKLTPFADISDVESAGDGILTHERAAPAWSFVARPGGNLRVDLLGQAVVAEAEHVPLQLSVVTATLAEVSPVRVKAQAWVEAEVLRGRLEDLRLALPEGYEVATVRGELLAGWRVDGGVLHIQPSETSAPSSSWEVVLDAPASAEVISPVLAPQGAFRSLVAAAIKVAGDGVLEVVSSGSARLAGAHRRRELPQPFLSKTSSPLILDDAASPPSWRILRPKETEVLAAQVDRLVVDVLLGASGQAAYQVWAVTRSTGATGLAVIPPDGFLLTDAGVDKTAAVPGVSSSGLVMPLRSSPDEQIVHVAGLIPLAFGVQAGRLTVPVPQVSAPVTAVEVRLVAPGGYSYTVETGKAYAGTISAPQVTSFRTQPSAALSDIAGAVDLTYAPVLYGVPPSHSVVTARWDALSARPGPLEVDVKSQAVRKEWF